MQKIPYMLVIGAREVEEGTVAVRDRSKGDLGSMTLRVPRTSKIGVRPSLISA
jgi:Threonyl-tRNA synthetase